MIKVLFGLSDVEKNGLTAFENYPDQGGMKEHI